MNRSLSYYFGEGQWKLWDGPIPWAPQPFEGEKRITINKFASNFDRRYAKIVAAKPIWTCVPATGELEDLRSAKVSERGLEWGWQVSDGDEKYAHWLWWVQMGPRAWLKIPWLPDAGREVTRPEQNVDMLTGKPTGEPLLGKDGRPVMRPVHEGLPGMVVRSHFEMIWDPLATWEGDARWCGEITLVACDEVKSRYGIRPAPETGDPGDRFWRRRFIEQLRGGAVAAHYEGGPDEEVCVLREFWFKPTEEHPDGRRHVSTKDEPLFDGANPHEDKELPYVGASERRVGKTLYGECVNWRLFDLSDELCTMRSASAEHRDIACNPPIVSERTQNVRLEEMEGGRSAVGIMYDHTGAPVPGYGHPGQLSPDFWRHGEAIDRDFAEVGEIPFLAAQASRDTSGKALDARIEEDETVLGPTRAAVAAALRRAGKLMLSRFRQFMPAPRIIRVAGRDHTIAAMKFSREDVRADLDVLVQLESGTKQSKAFRNSTIMQLIPLIQQTDPGMALELARNLEVGGIDRVFRRSSIHVSFAERQIERVSMSGQPEGPRPGENVEKSIAVWDPFLLSEDFEILAPEAQQALIVTYQAKQQALQQARAAAKAEMAQEAAMMAQVKGTKAAAVGGQRPGPASQPSPEEVQ